MRNMLLACAVLLLLGSVASISERHINSMETRISRLERTVSEEVTELKQTVSVFSEELAETKRELKYFQEAKNKKDDDVSNTKMAKRQINLNSVLDDERREQLRNLLSNSGISVDELATLLKGKDGMPGETGEPGPVGPPGYCTKSDCQGPTSYRTYWSQENVDSYIRVTNLPALTELTACFYFEPSHDDPIDALRTNSLGRMQHLISIASPSQDNAFLIRLYRGNGYPVMDLFGDLQKFTVGLGAFGEAHRHCFVWKAGSTLKWFYDAKQPGILKLAGTIPSNSRHDIRSGSALVPLHDQDSVGGSLDENQMIRGKIADFQMWDRALSDQEVQALGCDEKGSLVTFDDFDTVGLGKFLQGGDFQCTAST